MARARDEKKRQTIIKAAKGLFASHGFFNTSVADIVKACGLPVGTIYTYFSSKDEIVRAIVDEGWADLHTRLKNLLAESNDVTVRLQSLLHNFLPELFEDIDLINILLSEAIDLTRIEEKVEQLSALIYSIIKQPLAFQTSSSDFTPQSMKTALVVYFLGILNAVRITRAAHIGINDADILAFVRQTIAASLKIDL